METIAYKYSAFRIVLICLLILLIAGLNTYGFVVSNGQQRLLSIFGFVVSVSALIYFGNKFLLPLLNGQPVLEIDEEKLYYAIKDLTLYWKDIDDVDYEDNDYSNSQITRNRTFNVRFTMKDDNADIHIPTWFIAGDNADIFDSILNTFLKCKYQSPST